MRKTLKVVAFGGGPADAFIKAAGITDSTQQYAIKTLVNDLNGYGLWTKMKAIYPMVGGTASTHKFNLKDPRDLDAAYRLVFSGGWTHSSTGALPNGTNGYADTKFKNQGDWTSTSNGSMGFISRTNQIGLICDMGSGKISTGENSSTIYSLYTGNNLYAGLNCTAIVPGASNTNSIGFFATSRLSSSSYSIYKRGSSVINQTNTDAIGSNPNQNIYIGAGNDTGAALNYSGKEFSFAFIADGLTQAEIDTFYTIAQRLQTTLSRNI